MQQQAVPGLLYRGQVLLGVVSHVHLGYTRCLCRGLGKTEHSTVLFSVVDRDHAGLPNATGTVKVKL